MLIIDNTVFTKALFSNKGNQMVKVQALISRFPSVLGSCPKCYHLDIKLAGE